MADFYMADTWRRVLVFQSLRKRVGAVRSSRCGTWLFVVAIAGTLAACSDSRGGPVPYDVQSFGPPDTPKLNSADASYHVGPGDELAVSVYQVPDLNGEFQVDPAGYFDFPLIGKVKAYDRTSADIAKEMESRLGEKYLQSPRVVITIKNSASAWVTVDGAVSAPGAYPVTSATTLIKAVAMAHGPSDSANSRRVYIFRQISGQRYAVAFDLTDIRRGVRPDPQIYGGDIVVIDDSKNKERMKQLLSTIPLVTLFNAVGL